MKKTSIKILVYSTIDLILSLAFLVLMSDNMDIYFLPFVLFVYLKTGIFSMMLSKNKKVSSLKSKVIISIIGLFFLIGITMFYNLFGLVLLILLPIVIIVSLFVNTIKKNYTFEDSILILSVFFVNIFVYCDVILMVSVEAVERFFD